MALSAKPGSSTSNDGQTDQGRGACTTFPRGKPNGRVLARTGTAGTKANDNSPSGVHRRASAGGAGTKGSGTNAGV